MTERHDNNNLTTTPTGFSSILPWLLGGLAVIGGVILASSGVLSHLVGGARRGRNTTVSESPADATDRRAILRRQQDGAYTALFEERAEGNGASRRSWAVRGHVEGNIFHPETVETSAAGNNRFPAPSSLRIPIQRDGDTMSIDRDDLRGIQINAMETQSLPQPAAAVTPPAAEPLPPVGSQRPLPSAPGLPPIGLSSQDASLPESAPATPLASALGRHPRMRDPLG
jgi:hypothetical protein